MFWDKSVCPLGEDLAPRYPGAVTALDRRSTAALADSVLLPGPRVRAGLWFRMPDTLIDEICIPLSNASKYARDLRLIWECVDHWPPRALTRSRANCDSSSSRRCRVLNVKKTRDLSGNSIGVLLVRCMPGLRIDRQLSVGQFPVEKPLILDREEVVVVP